MINEQNLEKLMCIVRDEGNVFIQINDFEDYTAVRDVLPELKADCVVEFPMIVRIGKGKVKDIMPKSEYPDDGGKPHCAIRGFTCNSLKDSYAWRHCGMFDRHYDWKAREWRENYAQYSSDEEPNPFIKCYHCGNPFADDDFVYDGFFKTADGNGNFQLRILCKKCAYELANRVTDYVLLPDGNIKIEEKIRRNADES